MKFPDATRPGAGGWTGSRIWRAVHPATEGVALTWVDEGGRDEL